jgi:hypothetical protein
MTTGSGPNGSEASRRVVTLANRGTGSYYRW